MIDLPTRNDYAQLIMGIVPLLDVRAPVEYDKGSILGAINHPILNDNERKKVGTCYKQEGQDKAIELGHQLINEKLKAKRVAQWADFAKKHPKGALYCFRGGLRSKIAQQWLFEATGIKYPRVEGGYKALRQFALDSIDRLSTHFQWVVIAGKTGVGKTLFLLEHDNAIDLEEFANHTGSSFGQRVTAQPTQINFEHRIAAALLTYEAQSINILLVEDEGRTIGSVHLPTALYEVMQQSPLVLLEAPNNKRICLSVDEYIKKRLALYQSIYGDEMGFETFANFLLQALYRIRKRLGGELYQQLDSLLTTALNFHRDDYNLVELHIPWIRRLLLDYYDPMYDYQLTAKYSRLVKSGYHNELVNYCKSLPQSIFETGC